MNPEDVSFAAIPFVIAWLSVAVLAGERVALQRWYPANVVVACVFVVALAVLAAESFYNSRPYGFQPALAAGMLATAQAILIVKTRRLDAEASTARTGDLDR